MSGFNNFDWNQLKRYANAQAVKDLDKFLDAMPVTVGYNALVAAGMAWLIAGIAVFFTAMEVDHVSNLRAELAKVEALKPPIPVVTYTSVPPATLEALQNKLKATYRGIAFAGSSSSVTVSASDTDYFPQFLAAVNFLQNGGKNWRVSINSLCIGRDCKGSKLAANLKIEAAKVNMVRDQ